MPERTAVILIDALGAEIAAGYDFAPRYLPQRARLRSVLGFSQAALASIMTGLTPAMHGLWMMYRFEARSQFSFLRALAPFAGTQRRWVRSLITWKISALDGVTGYYSLYRVPAAVLSRTGLAAKRSVFEPGGGGNARSVIDEAAARGLRIFVRDYRTRESDAFRHLEEALREGKSDFHLLYTAGLDEFLHAHGTRDAGVGERLAGYAERIDALAAEHPDVRFIVLGDHGMCDVERTIDVMSSVERSGLRPQGDFVAFYDSTLARFRTRSERARRRLIDLLGTISGGRVLDDDELEALGVRFENGEFGDVVYLCDTGVIILPSYMGIDKLKGMHGYHPNSPCMDSMLCSNTEIQAGITCVTDLAEYLLPGFKGGELRR